MSDKTLLTVKRLTAVIADRRLFTDLSFALHRGEAIGLVGPNGAGKTTLIRHILHRHPEAGRNSISAPPELPFDLTVTGSLNCPSDVDIAWLPQNVPADLPPSQSDIPPGTVDQLNLQFGLDDHPDQTRTMSAGMRQKLALIRLLLGQSDLYLLDEPSNYLDLTGIVALEDQINRLKSSGSGFLMVTHDRELSDNVCDRTVYLSPLGVYICDGGVSAVQALEEQDVASRQHKAETIRRKIRQLETDCRTRMGWARQKEQSKRGAGAAKPHIGKLSAKMARRAKAVQQRIDRQKTMLQETTPVLPKEITLSLRPHDIRHRQAFRFENCSFSYEQGRGTPVDNPVLNDFSLSASTRDKICLMGGNGAGKTTLLRLISGELSPTDGRSYRNDHVHIAAIPQGLSDYFTHDILIDNFNLPGYTTEDVRGYLGAAMLRNETVLRSIHELSQGELMRAALVHAVLEEAEFLLLDEPTSHLDLESTQVLDSLLNSFGGGFLMVSHDRAFVSRVADQLYIIEDGHLRLI